MRKLRWRSLAACGLAVVAVVPVAAQSSPRSHRSGKVSPPSVERPVAAGCMRLCDADLIPCDPIQFKTADGRCSNPVSNTSM